MEFKQFYLGCLAHASYLIGSDGEAAVVDPQRDVEQYEEEARRRHLTIRYVIETHLHADFVSGHGELAQRTGAQIVFGAKANAVFPHRAVHDGDEVRLGQVVLRFLETPGHTPESVSILVIDTQVSPEPRMVLTGDTLFIGDVGRPDLVGAQGHSSEQMAAMIYDSLHGKLLTLPDHVEVFPAHGAGSLCGRNISKDTSSTIGEQRRSNYALKPMPKDQFVRMMTSDLPEAPAYFARDAALNREGPAPLADRALPRPLSSAEVARHADEGAVVLDVRGAAAFGASHIPGALNIGLGGQFASWAGTLLEPARPIVIVADDPAGVEEAAVRLARVGLENLAGYLDGGIAGWDSAGRELARLPQMAVDELKAQIEEGRISLQILDVRRPSEYAAGHIPGALNVPLDRLPRVAETIDASRPTAVACAGGYRSSAAASVLLRYGFRELYNVVGGTSAWLAAGFPTDTQPS
jgi:hydroxyacylglutathione hydrolase